MPLVEIVLYVIFGLSLLAFCYIYYYNLFQASIIRVNEVESDIDNLLRTKYELLCRVREITKGHKEIRKDTMEYLDRLKEEKLSSFQFDQELAVALNDFYKIREVYPEIKENDTFLKINIELEDIEEQIIACRDYYNDNITKYNKLVKSFPSILVGRIIKQKEKPFFDGKNMYDSIYNDFKL